MGLLLSFNESYLEKIQTISEMQKLYMENMNFSSKIRYFDSLAFIPLSDVYDAYEKILKLDFLC